MRSVGCLAAAFASLIATPAYAASAQSLYRAGAPIALGPGERWDYATFDRVTGYIYVAHGDHVTVVDPATRQLVGQIGPLPGGTHGIALSPDHAIGFTDDGEAGVAAAFDPKTFKILQRIPAAPDADGIVADPYSGHIFVINGDSDSITVIDPKTHMPIATITVGAGLEAGIADGHGRLFVDGAEKHEILSIDTHANKVVDHFPMPGCERPHGIALDEQTRRIFATCTNKVMVVVDADSGANLTTLPIGAFSDGAAFDPIHKVALSSNGDGTLTVVKERDPRHFTVLGNVPTAAGARTIALDLRPATSSCPRPSSHRRPHRRRLAAARMSFLLRGRSSFSSCILSPQNSLPKTPERPIIRQHWEKL